MWDDRDDLDVLDPLDAVLLGDLKDILGPPAVAGEPSTGELGALHAAVAARFPEHHRGEVMALRRAPRRASRVRSVWRTGSAAAAIIVASASGAAASGGVPIPRPVRALAYAVGLPVDSPALDDTHRHLQALDHALDEGDRVEIRRQAHHLQLAVNRVPDDERGEIADEVTAALAAVAPLLEGSSLETNDAVDETSSDAPPPATATTAKPATPPSSGGAGTQPGFPTPTTAPTAVTGQPESSTAEAPTTEAGTDAQPAADEAENDSSAPDPVAGPDEDAEPEAAPDPVTGANPPATDGHPDEPADAAP